MREWEIKVRGCCFRVWAPTLQDAFETFCIDMDFIEVPEDCLCDDERNYIEEMPSNITSGF
jgi:hypothetical protein